MESKENLTIELKRQTLFSRLPKNMEGKNIGTLKIVGDLSIKDFRVIRALCGSRWDLRTYFDKITVDFCKVEHLDISECAIKGRKTTIATGGPYKARGSVSYVVDENVIPEDAFHGCHVKTIRIPESVECSANTWKDCIGLENVYQGKKILFDIKSDTIWADAEGGMYNLEKHELLKVVQKRKKTYKVLEGTEKIADNAFEETSTIRNVILPDTIKVIGKEAFYDIYSACGDSFTIKVNLPHDLEHIGEGSLTNMEGDVILNEKLKFIGENAFENAKLGVVSLPDNLSILPKSIFWGADIAELKLPAFLEEIGDYAFYSSFIKEITLPASLKTIGQEAFCSCHELRKIVFLGVPDDISDDAFKYASSIEEIVIPVGSKEMFKNWLAQDLHKLIREQ